MTHFVALPVQARMKKDMMVTKLVAMLGWTGLTGPGVVLDWLISIRHILRYRAHFSPACQKSVFMKIA